jgi:hypothetical protein
MNRALAGVAVGLILATGTACGSGGTGTTTQAGMTPGVETHATRPATFADLTLSPDVLRVDWGTHYHQPWLTWGPGPRMPRRRYERPYHPVPISAPLGVAAGLQHGTDSPLFTS